LITRKIFGKKYRTGSLDIVFFKLGYWIVDHAPCLCFCVYKFRCSAMLQLFL
jgi:hypothetical protein